MSGLFYCLLCVCITGKYSGADYRTISLIGNIRAYTLSALYNAPTTMEQYYASLVNHDMAEG